MISLDLSYGKHIVRSNDTHPCCVDATVDEGADSNSIA